jgi:ribosomal protein L27
MLQPRLFACATSAEGTVAALASSLNSLSLCSKHRHLQLRTRTSTSTSTSFVRHASHAAQGRANGPGDSAGRRLGAKKTASEYVVPGNIIFKQRGINLRPDMSYNAGTNGHDGRHQVASWRQCWYRKGPHYLRDGIWLRSILPRPSQTSQETIYRSGIRKRRSWFTTTSTSNGPIPQTPGYVCLTDNTAGSSSSFRQRLS